VPDDPAAQALPDAGDDAITRLRADATATRHTALAMLCRAALAGDEIARIRVTRILAGHGDPGAARAAALRDLTGPALDAALTAADVAHRAQVAAAIAGLDNPPATGRAS
jgi:hypothetical protein